jgi:hypothetical protein
MSSRSERYLAVYSGVLTLAFGAIVLAGWASRSNAKFEEIDVQRINVLEPDGTLRMVISNKHKFPGGIYKGNEYPFQRDVAGLLFYNDEGTENGGLSYSGALGADGKVSAGAGLTLDQYEQDQVVKLNQEEDGGKRSAGLSVLDRPSASIEPLLAAWPRLKTLPADEAARQSLELQGGERSRERLFVGKDSQRNSVVSLRDADGRIRLRLNVSAEGNATIEFLDAEGKVQRVLAPDSSLTRR